MSKSRGWCVTCGGPSAARRPGGECKSCYLLRHSKPKTQTTAELMAEVAVERELLATWHRVAARRKPAGPARWWR